MRAAREVFATAVEALHGLVRSDERFLASFSGEESRFVRLNRGRIRQAGDVAQRAITVDLIEGGRHASAEVALGGDAGSDRAALAAAVAELRAARVALADDPHLLYSESAESVVRDDPDRLPDAERALTTLMELAEGLDLVGIWASGAIHAGFASSFGQASWHSVRTFSLDWSCYLAADRAVKCSYGGTGWDERELARKLAEARAALAALGRERHAPPPGRYRAYFAPAAFDDLLGLLGWGGFSCQSHRSKSTPLLRLATGEVALHPSVSLSEDRAAGFTPAFTGEGFRKTPRVPLIEAGRLAGTLISPRSAREFGLAPNSGQESPESLAMDGGDLPMAEAARRLGTGLWIANTWYCNYSDPNACRITGMTRFASFWVEDGVPVAPLAPMRFDDSLYGLLGDRLLGLTRERELQLSTSTYGGRSMASVLVPGVLVDGLALTL